MNIGLRKFFMAITITRRKGRTTPRKPDLGYAAQKFGFGQRLVFSEAAQFANTPSRLRPR